MSKLYTSNYFDRLENQHVLLILCLIKPGAFLPTIFFYLDILKIRAYFGGTQDMQRQTNGDISNY